MITKILFAAACVLAFLGNFDFITYTLKSAPKISIFPRWFWFLSFVSDAVLAYWYLNGMKF
jgi:hypothetical protein